MLRLTRILKPAPVGEVLRAVALAALCLPIAAQPPQRPPIVGVAHIAVKTQDLAASRRFYGHDLGFAEPFAPDSPAGGPPRTSFKVNDHQYIEVAAGLKSEQEDRLANIAFETTDARQLRTYLAAHNVPVPATLEPDADGNLSLMLQDPDGHQVEFVEYRPGSRQARNFGKSLPPARISDHMIHVGVTVRDRAAADRFYQDILGFREMWHGGMTDEKTDWVDMRVPDGTDWLEYMLKTGDMTPKTRGVLHHLALGVPDVDASYKRLLDRGVQLAQPPKVGRDGKRQLNMYDPDLTRSELMEPKPVQTPCCSPMLER